jgi:hypothetical protein
LIHAYLICEPETASSLPRRRGLGGARLRTARADGLVAVYSRHRLLQTSPELVMAHQKVIEAVMANGTVLPLRFGNPLQSESQLVDAIATRHEELVRAIERVRGHVEIGLRVIAPDLDQPSQARLPGPPSGRAYLLERAAKHRLAERAKREIHVPLTEMATAHVLASRVNPPTIVAASYLVSDDSIESFRGRAQQLATGVEEAQSFVTGPWPPYSFVDLRELPSERGRR